MAKKKRKRHRHPVAPPVHSAPESLHSPTGPRSAQAPAGHPYTPQPPVAHTRDDEFDEPVRTKPRRPQPARRRARRRRRALPWVIGVVVAALVAGVVVFQVQRGNKVAASYSRLAATAGCGKIQTLSGLARDHINDQRIHYATSPPAGGAHNATPLPAGVYDTEPSRDPNATQNMYMAVHSLEHGYIIVWHNQLTQTERTDLENALRNEPKVIVAPYALPGSKKMAFSAWGRLELCTKPSAHVAEGFISRYRNAKSAPEFQIP